MAKQNIHTSEQPSAVLAEEKALEKMAFAQAAIDYTADAAGLRCDTEVTLRHGANAARAAQLVVTHNGRRYRIPYDLPISLPACVALVLADAGIAFSKTARKGRGER